MMNFNNSLSFDSIFPSPFNTKYNSSNAQVSPTLIDNINLFDYRWSPIPSFNLHTIPPGHYGSNKNLCDTFAGSNHTSPIPAHITIDKRKDGMIIYKNHETGYYSTYNPDTNSWHSWTGP